jgi:hypothetical protein
MGTGSFPGEERPGRGVDHPPHLAPRLKEEQSYTSTPPLDLRGLFWGEQRIELILGFQIDRIMIKINIGTGVVERGCDRERRQEDFARWCIFTFVYSDQIL